MSDAAVRHVSVVGAGAAGAFFTLELARLCPDVHIDLYDRDDDGPGAGIVMSWQFADLVQGRLPAAFGLPESAMATWDRTCTTVGDEQIWSGAYGMFGLGRRVFKRHVRELAATPPNVRLHRRPVASLDEVADGTDLVVAADGAGSRLRQSRVGDFGTTISSGRTMFLWMSTPVAIDPSFVLRPVRPGLLVVHAYPHSEAESTWIVEADPDTLGVLGLLDRPVAEVEKILADLFAVEIRGAPLHAQTSGWQRFRTVVNDRWHSDRLVLLGDAAHTVHFSTGSGTTLAIEDAFCLARALAECRRVPDALRAYAAQRQPLLAAAQAEAAESTTWFERLTRRDRLYGHQTVFALRSRRATNTYERLRGRDPRFVAKTVEVLAGRPTDAEPIDVPLTVGATTLTCRTVSVARDGTGRAVLNFPVADGDGRCPLVTGTADGRSWRGGLALVVPPAAQAPDAPARAADALRAAGARLVGLLVGDSDTRPDEVYRAFDFLAVASSPGAGRCTRSELADQLRYDTGRAVLLLSVQSMSRDEINTLLAAGRVDLVAEVRPEDLRVDDAGARSASADGVDAESAGAAGTGRAAPGGSEVAAHQLSGPVGHPDVATRGELGQVRLDVEHRAAVDGVEAGNGQGQAVNGDESAHGHPEVVGAVWRTFGEDADARPALVAPRVLGAPARSGRQVEREQHLDVRIFRKAEGGVGFENPIVEFDDRHDVTPGVLLNVMTTGAVYDTDSFEYAHTTSPNMRHPFTGGQRPLWSASAEHKP